jgi:N-acetyl-anhydromuramyl-L-alanine amidase AmpD
MNKPSYIIIHCSATREDMDFTAEQVNASHIQRGFGKIGYHYYIRKDGTVCKGRDEIEIGAHDNYPVSGEKFSYNHCSIGICYEGGLDKRGKAKDTRTEAQKTAMSKLVQDICSRHPVIDILGHRDTSPDRNGDGVITPDEYMKECPCFDVKSEYTSFLPNIIVKP